MDWGEVALWAAGGALAGLLIFKALPVFLATGDTMVDLASLWYSVHTGDFVSARLDAISLMLPGVTGLGALNRAGDTLQTLNRLDIIGDTVRTINSADTLYDTGRAFNNFGNVVETVRYANTADSYYDLSRVFDNASHSTFDSGKLDRILRNLQIEGVDVYMGVEARHHLTEAGVEAMYRLRSGGRPGILILPDNPSYSAVIEELIHLGQDRNSGWTLYNKMTMSRNPILIRLEIEIDAKEKLLLIGKRLNIPQAEMDRTYETLIKYRKALREARGF